MSKLLNVLVIPLAVTLSNEDKISRKGLIKCIKKKIKKKIKKTECRLQKPTYSNQYAAKVSFITRRDLTQLV